MANTAAKAQDLEDAYAYQDVDAMFAMVDQEVFKMEKLQSEQALRAQRLSSVARERMQSNIATMKRHFKALTQSLGCELDGLLTATQV